MIGCTPHVKKLTLLLILIFGAVSPVLAEASLWSEIAPESESMTASIIDSLSNLFGKGKSDKTPKASCSIITNDLLPGSKDDNTDGEVSILQDFLARDEMLYPEGLVTGFFGPGTERAVKRLQVVEGLLAAPSVEIVEGVVGEATRESFHNRFCGDLEEDSGGRAISPQGTRRLGGGDSSLQRGTTPARAISATSTTQAAPGSRFERATVAATGEPPEILAIAGPRQIKRGEIGSWTIQAHSPEGRPLLYGVHWGDQGGRIGSGAGRGLGGSSSSLIPTMTDPQMSHVFSGDGAYEIVFSVTDQMGYTVHTTLTVKVGENVRYVGSRLTLELRDGTISCPIFRLFCNRLTTGEASIVRDFGTDQIPVGVSLVKDGFITFESLPAGTYIYQVRVPGFLPYNDRVVVDKSVKVSAKILLERDLGDVGVPPELLRLVPAVGMQGDEIRVTGSNLSPSDKVYFDGFLIGNLSYEDAMFTFNVPGILSRDRSCTITSRSGYRCDTGYSRDLRPGRYDVYIANSYGESRKATFEIFAELNKTDQARFGSREDDNLSPLDRFLIEQERAREEMRTGQNIGGSSMFGGGGGGGGGSAPLITPLIIEDPELLDAVGGSLRGGSEGGLRGSGQEDSLTEVQQLGADGGGEVEDGGGLRGASQGGLRTQ